MPRVKGGKTTHKKHKKFIKLAEGYWGSKNRLYKKASEQVEKGWQRAYKGRKLKKRDFRSLWIVRINAACRENAVSYSKFMSSLKKSNIELNRKQLAELAATDAAAFSKLVESVKAAV